MTKFPWYYTSPWMSFGRFLQIGGICAMIILYIRVVFTDAYDASDYETNSESPGRLFLIAVLAHLAQYFGHELSHGQTVWQIKAAYFFNSVPLVSKLLGDNSLYILYTASGILVGTLCSLILIHLARGKKCLHPR